MTSVFYIISTVSARFYKIGVCTNLRERISAIRTGCPFEIEYIFAMYLGSELRARSMENAFKCILNQFHARGEWYSVEAGETINDMIKILEKIDNEDENIFELETKGI